MLKFKHFEDYDEDWMEERPTREEYPTIPPPLPEVVITIASNKIKEKLAFLGWKFSSVYTSASKMLTTYKGRRWLYNVHYEKFELDTEYTDHEYSILGILARSYFKDKSSKDYSVHPSITSHPFFYSFEADVSLVPIKDYKENDIWTMEPKTSEECVSMYCNKLIKLAKSFNNTLDLQFDKIEMDNDDMRIVLISYINNIITEAETIPEIVLEKLSKAIHRCNFSLQEINEFKTENPILFDIMEKYMKGAFTTASKLNDLGF